MAKGANRVGKYLFGSSEALGFNVLDCLLIYFELRPDLELTLYFISLVKPGVRSLHLGYVLSLIQRNFSFFPERLNMSSDDITS